LLTGH
jgi:hypothetical protein